MLRVLISCHTCGPAQGSEHGMGWNWVTHISQHCETWVLTHPRHREVIEQLLSLDRYPNLHFVWVKPDRRIDPWDPAHGDSYVQWHYLLWQQAALKAALRLHSEYRFDVVHHVGWGSVSAPPPFWKLGAPFVWGPIGGGQTAPHAFHSYFDAVEPLRSLRVKFMSHIPQLRRTLRSSALVLSTNKETSELIRKACPETRTYLYPDLGVPPEFLFDTPPLRATTKQFRLLWAGGIEQRKVLPIALEAMAALPSTVPAVLRVAGSGPQRLEAEELARRHRLNVQFLGSVPWHQMSEQYMSADALLFTSLRDSFGSVVLEAMAHALPIIGFDHQGFGTFVPEQAAVKIPLSTPIDAVARVAESICDLAANPEKRRRIGEAGWAFAAAQAWPRRASQMALWYEQVSAGKTITAPETPRIGAQRAPTGRSPVRSSSLWP